MSLPDIDEASSFLDSGEAVSFSGSGDVSSRPNSAASEASSLLPVDSAEMLSLPDSVKEVSSLLVAFEVPLSPDAAETSSLPDSGDVPSLLDIAASETSWLPAAAGEASSSFLDAAEASSLPDSVEASSLLVVLELSSLLDAVEMSLVLKQTGPGAPSSDAACSKENFE